MKNIFTIAKKELIDTLRDRRTVITMIVVPLLLFPVIMYVFAMVQKSQIEKSQTKTLKIAVLGAEHASGLVNAIDQTSNMTRVAVQEESAIASLIRNDSIFCKT